LGIEMRRPSRRLGIVRPLRAEPNRKHVTGFNYTVWQYCELFQARNYVAEFVEPGGQSGGAEW